MTKTGKPKINVAGQDFTLPEPINRRQSCEIQERTSGQTLNTKSFKEIMNKGRIKIGFDYDAMSTTDLFDIFEILNHERNGDTLTLYPHMDGSANFEVITEGDLAISPYRNKQILDYWKVSLNFESISLENIDILEE